MDRCTKLEEMCSNWILKPKLIITVSNEFISIFLIKSFFFKDELLTQMKHRSRILSIAVTPILFSRAARCFFQNDGSLRGNNTLSLVRLNRWKRMKRKGKRKLLFALIGEFSLIDHARYLYVFRMLLQAQSKVH